MFGLSAAYGIALLFCVQDYEREQIIHQAEREKRQIINIACMGSLNPEDEGRPIFKVMLDQLVEFTGEFVRFCEEWTLLSA